MKGTVRLRKDGRWEGRVPAPRLPGQKAKPPKSVYASTEEECWRKVHKLMYMIDSGNFSFSGMLTVAKYLERWFEVYRHSLAESTQQGYKNYIHNHIIPYFDTTKLKDLKPFYIEEFYNSERKKKYSENTILQIHRILSVALKSAEKNELINKNPCRLVKAPTPRDIEIVIPELELFLQMQAAAVGTEHELPLLLAGFCGLRRSEIFGLTWNDINFNKGTLTIRQVVTTKEGNELDIKQPKTKLSARTIGIPQGALEVLAELKTVGYVASRDGKVEHPGNYSRRFKSFLSRNKFPHMRLHDLRHFHATLLLEADVAPRMVQARMGHATLQMVSRYQHITKRADAIVLAKMDAYIVKLSGQKDGQNDTEKKKAEK